MVSMMRALVGSGHGTELASVWMHTLQCAPSPSLNPRPFADKNSWTQKGYPTTCVGLSACLCATTETSKFPKLPLDSSNFISSSALAQILSHISSSTECGGSALLCLFRQCKICGCSQAEINCANPPFALQIGGKLQKLHGFNDFREIGRGD